MDGNEEPNQDVVSEEEYNQDAVTELYNSLDTSLNNFLTRVEKEGKVDRSVINRLKRIASNLGYLKFLTGLYNERLNLDANPCRVLIESFELMFPLYTAVYSPDNEQQIPSEVASTIKEIMRLMISIINSATFNYMRPCHFITEANGLKVIFQYLTSDILVNAYVKLAEDPEGNPDFYELDDTLGRLVFVLILLGRLHDKYLNKWKEVNAIRNLLDYLKQTKNISSNHLACCMAIAFIATDADFEQLPQLREVVPVLCGLIGQAAILMESHSFELARRTFTIDETPVELGSILFDDGEETTNGLVAEAAVIMDQEAVEWSLLNLIKSLYHLSVSDNMKHEIFEKNHMNKYLKMIILHGNEIEQEYSLNLLMQLCFNSDIKDKVAEDKELVDRIKYFIDLGTSPSQDEAKIKKLSKSIIWMLEKQSTPEPVQPEPSKVPQNINTASLLMATVNNVSVAAKHHVIEAKQTSKNEKHIMISYNRDSRDLCLKIKKELEEMGHKVWIDVESISGSSMEAMAKAVEDSACVLMCMTEKYKQSNNCRAEAEYSFQRNKIIIPLIMQKDWMPDGWLGFILGSKIFVHFMKYDFEECIRRLKLELKSVFKVDQTDLDNVSAQKTVQANTRESESATKTDSTMQKASHSINKSSGANSDQVVLEKIEKHRQWTSQEVKEWLESKSIHPVLANMCKGCDGRILYEMSLIKKESPEFFFRALAKSNSKLLKHDVYLRDVALFNAELKALFS